MTEKKLSREEIIRHMPRNPTRQVDDARFVANTLKLLSPVYGYHPADVVRIDKACRSRGLLNNFREDAEIGHLIPRNLIIGGITGVTHAKLLSLNIGKQQFLNRFLGYVEEFGEVVFVFPVTGSKKPWVMHNLEVSPGKSRHCVSIYNTKHGGRHIRVIRIENFIKEFSNE
jgi:hypothetical protein